MSVLGSRRTVRPRATDLPRPLFRLEELLAERFERDRGALAERYPGAWIALSRDGVVAVSDSRAGAEADALEWCPSGTFIVRPVTRVRHPSQLVGAGRR